MEVSVTWDSGSLFLQRYIREFYSSSLGLAILEHVAKSIDPDDCTEEQSTMIIGWANNLLNQYCQAVWDSGVLPTESALGLASFSTGNGILEAYFAHDALTNRGIRSVNLVGIEPVLDNLNVWKSYETFDGRPVFCTAANMYEEFHGEDTDVRLHVFLGFNVQNLGSCQTVEDEKSITRFLKTWGAMAMMVIFVHWTPQIVSLAATERTLTLRQLAQTLIVDKSYYFAGSIIQPNWFLPVPCSLLPPAEDSYRRPK
jgi:hypothetical protein